MDWLKRQLPLAVLAGQFLVVIALVRVYGLEGRAFIELCLLALVAFPINAWLPPPARIYFFTAVSLAGVFVVMSAAASLWIIGVGAALIGMCHLPVRMGARVALIALVGLGLGVLRFCAASPTHNIASPWPSVAWPILGSMFMFRLIIYLYDISHAKKPTPWVWSAAYFFMLPNVYFPLFPVVDFKKFQTGYYNEDALRIYRRGMHWMFRGAVHLLIYRYVYHKLTLAPTDVGGLGTLLQYMLATFFLYLRVSGHFHFIVGMLLIFGFNLPPTNHLYFLASGFNDYWRRMNIYWKDFMMKIFFYPMFFKWRKWGETRALILATLATFGCTALLHPYQTFWIRGELAFRSTEVLYWTILAVLVAANTLYERRYGRQIAEQASRFSVYGAVAHVLKIAIVFSTMCGLWSFWDAPTIAEWTVLWTTTGYAWAYLGGGFIAVCAVAVAMQVLHSRARPAVAPAWLRPRAPSTSRTLAAYTSVAAALVLLGLPAVHQRLPATIEDFVGVFRNRNLNARDRATQTRGYYERLNHASFVSEELARIYKKRPPGWNLFLQTPLCRETDNLLRHELVPGQSGMYKNALMSINSHGMRDQEYTRKKPPGVYRLAILGASPAMGEGVADSDVFEAVAERRVNANNGGPHERYEFLNFSVAGYDPLCYVWQLERTIFDFEPDAVLVVGQINDVRRFIGNMARLVDGGTEIPFPWVADILEQTGIAGDRSSRYIERKLIEQESELARKAYGRIGELCRERGLPLVYLLQPVVQMPVNVDARAAHLQLVADVGFIPWDVTDAFDGSVQMTLRIASWDRHPNAKAHALVADAFYEMLAGPQDAIPFEPRRND